MGRVDVSFILIIAVSAVLMAAMMIYAEVTSRRHSVSRLTFGISYLFGLAMMQPWQIESAQDAGMAVMMLIYMAIWVMMGCAIGAAPTAMGIALFKWAKRGIARD